MCKANHYSVHFKCLTIFYVSYTSIKLKFKKKKHLKPKGNNIVVGEINVIENRGERSVKSNGWLLRTAIKLINLHFDSLMFNVKARSKKMLNCIVDTCFG